LVATSTNKPKRTVEEALHYSVGHRIRIEILTILNDGPASHSALAKAIGQGVSKIGHHIQELVDQGSIELAGIEQARNQNVHIYRAIERSFISDAEARELPSEANNEAAAYILQALTAEAMAALWTGKLDASEKDVWMSWRSANLDAQGRQEVADEQAESYKRLVEIEERAADRLAESGQAGTSTIIAALGFERSRQSAPSRSTPQAKTD
jgi:predicted transcriptional regulator